MKILIRLFLMTCVLFVNPLNGEDQPEFTEKCFRELQKDFFDNNTVTRAMSLYIPYYQNQWSPILRTLQSKSRNISQELQKRARASGKSPLSPFDPVEAEKLLMSVYSDIFTNVLNYYGLNDPSLIEGMFSNIRHVKEGKCVTSR